MTAVLVATGDGCRAFLEPGAGTLEFSGHPMNLLVPEANGSCLAVVEERQIWRRKLNGDWSLAGNAGIPAQSLTAIGDAIYVGGLEDAVMARIGADGKAERLAGFDEVPGRQEWFAGGPPLGVRSLTATAGGGVLLAAVHVGGIPRSVDGGETWQPTMPVMFDAHEVSAHPSLSNMVAAAAAVGLCVSRDGGLSWKVITRQGDVSTSLAVAMLPEEALFSVQEGPFAGRSQIWRWRLGSDFVEQVRDGLPEWLDGKVDTAHIAAGRGRAAVVDGGGNLWVSVTGSVGWKRISANLEYVFAVAIV